MMRKQDNFLENILWLKRRPKSSYGAKYVVIKGEHGALLFHDLQVFFASFAIGRGFDPTGAGRYFAGGFAGFITQSENVSFENMKNAIIWF
jgi:sugar/nucleoside kinase (ribokinase family)